MQEQKILGLSLFTFQASDELTSSALAAVKKEQFENTAANLITKAADLHTKPEFQELHEWFDQCLATVNQRVGYPFPKLEIILSWANLTETGFEHHFHMHNNSLVSGVFYLTEGKGGETYFSDNVNLWKRNLFFLYGEDRESAELAAKRGRLVVFPSNLRHGVRLNLDDEPRYSIAFNAFPKGSWGGVVQKNKIVVN
jgi:uncharacterized protein (TIGR02466 family)